MHKNIDLENECNNRISPYMKPFYSGERCGREVLKSVSFKCDAIVM